LKQNNTHCLILSRPACRYCILFERPSNRCRIFYIIFSFFLFVGSFSTISNLILQISPSCIHTVVRTLQMNNSINCVIEKLLSESYSTPLHSLSLNFHYAIPLNNTNCKMYIIIIHPSTFLTLWPSFTASAAVCISRPIPISSGNTVFSHIQICKEINVYSII